MKWFIDVLSRTPCANPLYIRLVKYAFNTIPWIGIFLLFAWSYEIVVVNFALPDLQNGYLKRGGIHFFVYHLLGGLCFWSYYASALVRPVNVQLDEQEEEDYEKIKALLKQKQLSQVAYPNMKVEIPQEYYQKHCKRCDFYKPERAHHCSWCERCILKMDHHCPWIGNCVGGHNYKYFIQMLLYTSLFTCYVAISIFFNVITIERYKSDTGATVVTLGAISLALSIGTGLLLSGHIYLLFSNSTTLEVGFRIAECSAWRIPPSPYDLGCLRNFTSVFGTDPYYWFIPLHNQIPKVTRKQRPAKQQQHEETLQLLVRV